MTTNVTRSHQATAASAATAAMASQTAVSSGNPASPAPFPAESTRKPSAYGLPCSKCRLYYPADLDACPHCHHHERVSPVAPEMPPRAVRTAPAPTPDSTTLDKEREEFLRQFKSQLLEAHAGVTNGPVSACKLPEHRAGGTAGAEICKACYERLQDRLDVCEAALHMDLKEAAQIVYNAVWTDPSDTGKTYQNAANALLTELRKRAGMSTLLGPFQPLPH
jgi:hypothetical protein